MLQYDETNPTAEHNKSFEKQLTTCSQPELVSRKFTALPPNGGYGWVIVAAAFVGQGFTIYNVSAVSVLLLDLKYEFDVPYANLNIIFSLLIGCIYITAPIVSVFGNRFGSRAAVMLGGALQSVGITIASFSPSMIFTHIFLGFITGLGMSFSAMPLSVETGRYFTSKRSLALGIQQVGPSLFGMVGAPLTQYLINVYSWRGALFITGALNLNVVACGAALRPLHLEDDVRSLKKDGSKKLLDLTLFKLKNFNLYIFTLALLSPAQFLMSYYVIAYAISEQHFTEYQAAFLVTISTVFGIAGRLVTGVVATYTRFTCFTLMIILCGSMAICYIIYPEITSYWASALLLSVYEIGLGGLSPMAIAGLTEIVGPSRLMSAFGIQGVTGSVAAILGQPFAGWLSDVFGTLRVVFWIGFALMGISSSLLFSYCCLFDSFTKRRTESAGNT